MARTQLPITISEPLKAYYRKWCADRGYDWQLVFWAGWRALATADLDDRTHWFDSISEWLESMEKAAENSNGSTLQDLPPEPTGAGAGPDPKEQIPAESMKPETPSSTQKKEHTRAGKGHDTATGASSN